MPASAAYTDDLYTNQAESSAAAARRPTPSSIPNLYNLQTQSLQTDPSIPVELLTTSDKKYLIFDAATSETFLEWYETTQWYHNGCEANSEYNLPTWQMKGKTARELWDQFDQLAKITTGEAKVECKHCHQRLAHPSTSNKGGTSTLRTYLRTKACKKMQGRGATDQPTIVEAIDAAKARRKVG
jgi:hypothetical protein